MKTIHVDANGAWLQAVRDVMAHGDVTYPRDQATVELLGYSSTFDMKYPIVSVNHRKLSRRFLTGEAVWILTGDDRVESIAPYAPSIVNFSDDGVRFYGAYGPRIADQFQHVVRSLANDNDSRQAVLTTWRPNPPKTKDTPCTVAVQWFIRNGRLHCIDTMRSSDLWLGWVYDVFNFSMLSAVIALQLRTEYGLEVSLGTLTLNAGSQHVYERNFEKIRACLDEPDAIPYQPMRLELFHDASHLVKYLTNVRDGTFSNEAGGFLHEFQAR